MSTNHTSNYNLSQWDAEDKVQRVDFNADNAKIDAALGEHAAALAECTATMPKLGNCVAHYAVFSGDNAASRTFTFPHRPLFFTLATSDENCRHMSVVRGSSYGHLLRTTGADILYVSWADKAVTIGSKATNGAQYLNKSGQSYFMITLLDAEN